MRQLKLEERRLLEILLEIIDRHDLIDSLPSAKVESMDDGGMGSISFCDTTAGEKSLPYPLVEGLFKDADGVEVSVTVNVYSGNKIAELDIFKADFSQLIRMPTETSEVKRIDSAN